MAKYKVLHGTNINHKGKLYTPGEEIDLPDDIANRLKEYLQPINDSVIPTKAEIQNKKEVKDAER
jgi:hypothetical protein